MSDWAKPVYANIRGRVHADICVRRETYGGTYVGTLGDVRRCEHGKVQMLVNPENRSMAGPGTWFWMTLHPFWDLVTFLRAVKAIDTLT